MIWSSGHVHDERFIPWSNPVWFDSIPRVVLVMILPGVPWYLTFLTFKTSFGMSPIVERRRYRTPLYIWKLLLWFLIPDKGSSIPKDRRVHLYASKSVFWSILWFDRVVCPSWPISVFENWVLVLISVQWSSNNWSGRSSKFLLSWLHSTIWKTFKRTAWPFQNWKSLPKS